VSECVVGYVRDTHKQTARHARPRQKHIYTHTDTHTHTHTDRDRDRKKERQTDRDRDREKACQNYNRCLDYVDHT